MFRGVKFNSQQGRWSVWLFETKDIEFLSEKILSIVLISLLICRSYASVSENMIFVLGFKWDYYFIALIVV